MDRRVKVAVGARRARKYKIISRAHSAILVKTTKFHTERQDGEVNKAVLSMQYEGIAGATIFVFLMVAPTYRAPQLKGLGDPIMQEPIFGGIKTWHSGHFAPLAATTILSKQVNSHR